MNVRAYKCWFEFLKRSMPYRECCASGGQGELSVLYASFGDVHAPGLRWEDWWPAHEYLFSKEPHFVIDEIQVAADFYSHWDEGQEDLLTIVINLHEPKQTILDAIEKLIAPRQLEMRRKENELIRMENPNAKITERFGRPKIDSSFYHLYGLAAIPTASHLDALERTLEVFDLCKKDGQLPPDNREAWFEVAEFFGIMTNQSEKTKADQAPFSPVEERAKRAEKAKRYFRQAKEIIENVERGIFPKHNG